MTVEKIKKLEDMIKPILEDYSIAREDDLILYGIFFSEYYPELLHIPVRTFLLEHKLWGVPNIKSIERARRKVQEKFPELASERAKRKRAKEQATYEEYARGGSDQ